MRNIKEKPKIKNIAFSKDWILFEDEHLIFINKPSGLLSVPGKDANPDYCIVGQLNQYLQGCLIVHRLDMDTSGIMVLAKDKQTHKALSRQFQERQTKKEYQAICSGIASQKNGSIKLPMRCDWANRPIQIIDFKQGKHAQTNWQVIEQKTDIFKVLLSPVTGRSHQLRLHMKQLGHPILGDNLYADKISYSQKNRLMLHASKLKLTHPNNNKPLTIKDTAEFWHI